MTGKAGDVILLSETVIHNGLLKTTPGVRSNIYFSYTHAHHSSLMRAPMSRHHFFLPPPQGSRLTPTQLEFTE